MLYFSQKRKQDMWYSIANPLLYAHPSNAGATIRQNGIRIQNDWLDMWLFQISKEFHSGWHELDDLANYEPEDFNDSRANYLAGGPI
jgi:hypothetical protein